MGYILSIEVYINVLAIFCDAARFLVAHCEREYRSISLCIFPGLCELGNHVAISAQLCVLNICVCCCESDACSAVAGCYASFDASCFYIVTISILLIEVICNIYSLCQSHCRLYRLLFCCSFFCGFLLFSLVFSCFSFIDCSGLFLYELLHLSGLKLLF